MRPRFLLLAVLFVFSSTSTARAQDRHGFTLLLTMGYGIQSGDFTSQSYTSYGRYQAVTPDSKDRTGLAGLNFGIGGFVTKDNALMLRFSGIAAEAEYTTSYDVKSTTDVTSGAVTLDLQHWMEDRWNFEAGAGWGIIDNGHEDHRGLGLFAALGYSFLLRGSHSLQIGVEDALYHDSDRDINSLGICLGFQFL